MRSWDPLDYRMVTATIVDEYVQQVTPTNGDHAQLGMSIENFQVVALGPSDSNIIAINRKDTWAGKSATGVHELSSVSGYQEFIANGLTALPWQSSDWTFIAGAADVASGRHDLVGINPHDFYNGVSATGIHVLTGASNHQSFTTQVLSVLGPTDPASWVFLAGRVNSNGLPDIIAINRHDAWGGRTATGMHILSGADEYQSWTGYNGLTALGETNLHDWQFAVGRDNSNGQHRPDLIAINLHDQGGIVGFHILSGADSYQSFFVHQLTTLPSVSDRDWTFIAGPEDIGQGYRDVSGINRNDVGGMTGVHIFKAVTNYQTRDPEVTSGLPSAVGDDWVFSAPPPN